MTKRIGLRLSVAALVLGAASVAVAADPAMKDSHAGHSMSGSNAETSASAGGTSASMQMHQVMMDGMKQMQSMQPSGDVDQDYAKMIEKHHAQAVRMTQAYLKGAKDPKLKAWAQKSLESQQQELEQLQAMNLDGESTRRQAEATTR
jgi:uncharacterized protein (DUF305 family)